MSSSVQGTSSFTFLSQESEDDIDSTAVEGRLVGSAEDIKKNPWQATAGLPYDSSDDNDDGDDDNTVVEDADGDAPSKSTSQLDDLFFFHPDDPELENRINGELRLAADYSKTPLYDYPVTSTSLLQPLSWVRTLVGAIISLSENPLIRPPSLKTVPPFGAKNGYS